MALVVLMTSGCPKPPPNDGGLLVRNGLEVYWAQEDFPIEVLFDQEMPPESLAAVYLGMTAWNEAVGLMSSTVPIWAWR
jgi:hypothetical protein